MANKRKFDRYIGVDYSGADLPTKRMPGLAVCVVNRRGCAEFPPPLQDGPVNQHVVNWNRRDIARWLVERLKERETPTLVGIDHAFSFPLDYFEQHLHLTSVPWDDFLDDFQECWPTDQNGVTVRSQYNRQLRRMMGIERGEYCFGLPNWARLTDPPGASMVFNFLTKRGEVATSTHAGLPWLRYIRRELREAEVPVRFWPFDGWEICEGRSVVVEAYPRIWREDVDPRGENDHQQDAHIIARWMWEADRDSRLEACFAPNLNGAQYVRAREEGWIFGVMDPIVRDGG